MNGVLVVNKSKGMTSFDVVRRIGEVFHTKKVGHTGTLDPLAEGVLIVCIGQALKISELLTAEDKEYIAKVRLGVETDTYDVEGKVLEEKEVPHDIPLEEVVSSFQKTYFQEVPIYSAVKVNGKKLYEYARGGEKLELPKKEVTIKEIEFLGREGNTFTFRAHVTKGCYIRSLIHDIGVELGTGACMETLLRTRQGNVSLEEAYTLEDIENGIYKIYSIDEIISFPQIIVDKELEFKIKNGVKIPNQWKIADKVLFQNEEKQNLGIYEVEGEYLKTWKNFSSM